MGTRERNGQPESMSMGSGQIWRAYFLGGCHPWGVANGVKTTDAFPQMQAYTGSMPADIRWGLGRATRITVYREKLEDIILPPSALTAEVQKVFRPCMSSPERVHGPVGSASLVLLVPRGKRVTVIKGKQVRACGLQASISIELESCAGDIHLSLEEALRGEVLLDKVHLTAFTLCGRIQSTAFEGRDKDKPLLIANNSEVMVLSNAHSGLDILAADFMLKSEAGAIAIEKMT